MEKVYSLKELRNLQNPETKQNRKVEVMKKNAIASIAIRAHQEIEKHTEREDTLKLVNEIHAQVRDGAVPEDAFKEIWDAKVANLQNKVDRLTAMKFKNNGELKRGDEASLAKFTQELVKMKQDREEFFEKKKTSKKVEDKAPVEKPEAPKQAPKIKVVAPTVIEV